MGYASRQNPNSSWNKKRNTVKQVMTPPSKGEPVIIKVNSRNMLDLAKDFICRLKTLFAKPTRQKLTN